MVLTFNNDQFRILSIGLYELVAARHRHDGVLASVDDSDRSGISLCYSVDVQFLSGYGFFCLPWRKYSIFVDYR